VRKDGASSLVSYGMLNLTHDVEHARTTPLRPGRRISARVALNDVAHAFPAGHRLRVAVSPCCWPLVWPSPEAVTLTVWAGASTLELPVRPLRAEDAVLPDFGPPEAGPGPAVEALDPAAPRRRVDVDPGTGEVVCTTLDGLTAQGDVALARVEPIDLEVGYGVAERLRIGAGDPLSAEAEFEHTGVLRRGSWSVRVETRSRITASREAFRVEAELRGFEGDAPVFARRWDERIPRRGI
jgi:uncharacterized protein